MQLRKVQSPKSNGLFARRTVFWLHSTSALVILLVREYRARLVLVCLIEKFWKVLCLNRFVRWLKINLDYSKLIYDLTKSHVQYHLQRVFTLVFQHTKAFY
jgi:hypothetical protein